jgi:hypothetical protein
MYNLDRKRRTIYFVVIREYRYPRQPQNVGYSNFTSQSIALRISDFLLHVAPIFPVYVGILAE